MASDLYAIIENAYSEGYAAAALCATGVGTDGEHPMRFAIADGNHSLAAARQCWLEKKKTLTPEQAAVDPARYALVELVNLHSPAVTFEPIHRVLFETDAAHWLDAAEAALAAVNRAAGETCFELASVDAVTLAGQGIVVAQVYSLRDGQRLLGSAFLNEDPDNAAVHSVLSAVNRRLSVLPRTAG
mgnify:CR=1 FL=1